MFKILWNTLKDGLYYLRNESVSMKVFLLNMHEVRILFDLGKRTRDLISHTNFFSTKTAGLVQPEAVNVETNSERHKIKEEEMRGIMEEYGEVKSIKLRFHPNNTRNEAMICFFTEEEAQLAIAEINTYIYKRKDG